VDVDAVIVGAGPNGLVAANILADAGWAVLVLEGQPEPGGAVRSAEVTAPGFCNDLFSAFYPLGVASPVLRRLELERPALVARPAGAGPPPAGRPNRGSAP
jgi:phytoene dehydrogenase-like protein